MSQSPTPPSTPSEYFTPEIDACGEIQLFEVVGKGTFGVVRKARWRDKIVAVKLIETEQEIKAFKVEVRQLSRVNHPNIVKLYGASTKPPNVCLVMEYAEGGSLYNVLHCTPNAKYTVSHALSWVLQCAHGVAYLHSMKPKALIHRDLKPPNLLLVSGGTILKICDFGTACDAHTHMTNNKGSAAWMAPEVFESWNYSEKCDVFSWGIIFWEVLARRKPFDEIGGPAFRIMWAVHKGERPPLLRNCPPRFESLMTKCWSQDADDRPSMDEVVNQLEMLYSVCPQPIQPLEYTPQEDDLNSSFYENGPTMSTAFSLSPNVQTQLDVANQIVTEPPVYNSGTNITDPHLQSKMNSAFSIPMQLESGLNLPYINWQSQFPLPTTRRSSEIHEEPSSSTASKTKGHRRSGSYGAPVSNYNASSTNQPNNDQLLLLQPPCLNTRSRSYLDNSHIDPCEAGALPLPPRANRPATSTLHLPYGARKQSLPIPSSQQCFIGPSENDFNAFLLLEPRLQPLQPDPTDQESRSIFSEHRKLSQDYLKMQMEVTLLMERKRELEKQSSNLGSADEYWELKTEQDGLLQLRSNLQKQLDVMKKKQRAKEAEKDGDWVLVD